VIDKQINTTKSRKGQGKRKQFMTLCTQLLKGYSI
jgi:hypothetical protein